MPRIFPIRGRRSNEELFFDYYSQIMKWALQLSHLDQDDASDLVQDFYLQIAQINVALAEVEEIEPYLFKILRNLHYSRLRRQGKTSRYELSIMEFDSLERGLAAIDRNGLFLVRANLRHICEFACRRKDTSRAASVFILRFFLGYYSSEVMKLAHMTRMGVDRALQVARRDVRLHLDKPGAMRSAIQPDQHNARPNEASSDSKSLFLELRQIIFNSCDGDHLSDSVLDLHYASDSAPRFSLSEFAHMVSCKRCLDRVNRILGLPLLDDRSPDDTIGRDNPPGSGTGSGFSVAKGKKLSLGAKERKALDRRMREFLEHRPDSLEIAIDGETRTTQRVTAEISELKLKLNRAEEPGFIEVFSEQGVRLAYLHVTEPTQCPELEQRQHLDLSDGRSLDIVLSYANDLSTIHVIYRDPVFAEAINIEDEENGRPILVSSEQSITLSPESASSSSSEKTAFSFRYLLSALENRQSRMNPLFTTAVVFGLASILCFILWTRSGPGITAHDLLLRAQKQEASVAQREPSGVIVQRVRIKALSRTTERTLYRDIQHKRHAKEQGLDASDAKLKAELAVAGVDWNDPLSAADYRDWRNHEFIASDSVKRAGDNLLTLTTKSRGGDVVSESLTVRASDFHTVGRAIELRSYGTVEIAELNYDVLPWSAVNPEWFEPLAALPRGVSSDVHPSLLPHLPQPLSELELDQAELQARLALNHLHAEGERLEIARGATGVRVQGIVETAARKREIEQELDMLPHVIPAISTFEEVARQASAANATTSIAAVSAEAEPSPLEKYLLAKGESREEISEAYRQFFRSSVVIGQNSRAIAELQQRFATGERLTETAQTALQQLVAQDKADIEAALRTQDSLLRQMWDGAAVPGDAAHSSVYTSGLLASASGKNASLCNELIGGGSAQSRNAEAIFADLSYSIAQVREIVNRIPDHPQSRNAQSSSPPIPIQPR